MPQSRMTTGGSFYASQPYPTVGRAWLAPLLGLLAIAAFPGAALAAPPVNTTAPSITIPTGGASTEITNPSEGRTLTSTPGTWNPAQTTYAYHWTQATGRSRGTTPGPPGQRITAGRCDVQDKMPTPTSAIRSASPSAQAAAHRRSRMRRGFVTGGTPIDRRGADNVGPTQDGQTLTASAGGMGQDRNPSPTATSGGAAIAPASTAAQCWKPHRVPRPSTSSRTLTSATRCRWWSPRPTPVGPTVQGSFAENGVVTPGNTGVPTISGTAQVGKTLTEVAWLLAPQQPDVRKPVGGLRRRRRQLLRHFRGEFADVHVDPGGRGSHPGCGGICDQQWGHQQSRVVRSDWCGAGGTVQQRRRRWCG